MTDAQSEIHRQQQADAGDFEQRNAKLIKLVRDSMNLHVAANDLLMETYHAEGRNESATAAAKTVEPETSGEACSQEANMETAKITEEPIDPPGVQDVRPGDSPGTITDPRLAMVAGRVIAHMTSIGVSDLSDAIPYDRREIIDAANQSNRLRYEHTTGEVVLR